jgi:putative endonuclease
MPDWYLYIVRCQGGSLYTGIATDVRRRLAEHQRDKGLGSKYLRGRGPFELVFEKKIGSRSLALRLENKIKRLPKAKKEALVKTEECIELILKQISP